ncbi:hypothetical protein LINPERPRIM_LOCUS29033, partial [Linum perenne]
AFFRIFPLSCQVFFIQSFRILTIFFFRLKICCHSCKSSGQRYPALVGTATSSGPTSGRSTGPAPNPRWANTSTMTDSTSWRALWKRLRKEQGSRRTSSVTWIRRGTVNCIRFICVWIPQGLSLLSVQSCQRGDVVPQFSFPGSRGMRNVWII